MERIYKTSQECFDCIFNTRQRVEWDILKNLSNDLYDALCLEFKALAVGCKLGSATNKR